MTSTTTILAEDSSHVNLKILYIVPPTKSFAGIERVGRREQTVEPPRCLNQRRLDCQMKNSRLGSLAAALVTFNIPVPHAASAQTSSSCELRPVMIENFDEETAPNRRIESISSHRIGPARWTAHTPWGGDFGDASFMDPGPGGPFKIKDGILSITA